MLRSLVFALLLIPGMASLSCRSYTTGLEQSSVRMDEAAALATLRAIGRAQTTYNVSNSGAYGSFEQLAAGGYLDSRFDARKPKIYGYVLTMNANSGTGSAGESSYACNADPDPSVNRSGRHFYLDSASPLIHVNASQPASAKDETINP